MRLYDAVGGPPETAVDVLVAALDDLPRQAPLIERASARLSETFQRSWVQASATDAGILGRAIVRVAMSYISMPPESDRDVAADLAELLGPFIDRSARRD